MSPDRWRKIDELLEATLERRPEERAAFLAETCADDEELRREVETLLAAHDKAGGFMTAPALEVAAKALAQGETALPAGSTLNHYRVLSFIGAGGMGAVYLAQDTRLGRKVALKLLPPQFTADADRVRRFRQEARAASALNHPNIVTIYDIGEATTGTGSAHFIAAEFVDGQTLREGLSAGPLELRDAVAVTAQVGDALAAAHAAGIVHRDIKPENVMLRGDGYAKVLDFGLAKLAEGSAENSPPLNSAFTHNSANTTPGVVMGTVAYMSPEQVRGRQVDGRSDIFSLGVVLYELVTGRAPFIGDSSSEVMASILRDEPPPLSKLRPEIPAELERIVRKALRKNPGERYQTAKDFALDLKGLRNVAEFQEKMHYAGQALPETVELPETGRKGRPPKSNPMPAEQEGVRPHLLRNLIILSALLVLAAAALGYWLYGRSRAVKPGIDYGKITITKLSEPDRVENAAISPDGKYLAVVASNGQGQESLYVKQLATGSRVRLASFAGDSFLGLSFSPDGQYVYYPRKKTDQAVMLHRLPILGGEEKRLPVSPAADANGVPHFALSPDGQRIAYLKEEIGGDGTGLMVSRLDGTGEQRIVSRKVPEQLGVFAWSPGGERITYVSYAATPKLGASLIDVDLTDGTERALGSPKLGRIYGMAWLSDGSGIIVSGDILNAANTDVWQISYPEGEYFRLTSFVSWPMWISVTSDAKLICTVAMETPTSILLLPAERMSSPINVPLGDIEIDPNAICWTPDGKLIYSALQDGRWNLWQTSPDGSIRQQLTADEHGNYFPSVSANGRHVVFGSRRGGDLNVWRMNIDGSELKQLTHDSDIYSSSISPDGRTVVYLRGGHGSTTLWKVPFEGGSPVQLTNGYVFSPQVSPDGKLIACLYRERQADSVWRIAVLPAVGGDPIRVFQQAAYHGSTELAGVALCWTPDGQAVTYAESKGKPVIWNQPLDGGKPQKLATLESREPVGAIAWSPDKKSLACVRFDNVNRILLLSGYR
jgi:eukaryotic-like serine/threonine-protein kinase